MKISSCLGGERALLSRRQGGSHSPLAKTGLLTAVYYGNVTVGESADLSLTQLREMGFDAIVVAVGAQGTKWLGLPGEDIVCVQGDSTDGNVLARVYRRLDEEDPRALVQTREPVNKFPDFVAYIVRRLKVLCPTMGKVKIAQVLCRAGLHLGSTTVQRMLAERSRPAPAPDWSAGRS